ncbi:pyrophosphatase PpaX [Paenibacillus alginolyticus]|uniref:pyrophosphatase PpaX n=1 Tax=Paenibacillus alginolyticus TaxID=59839 RepID=UPI000421731D|nr:pyrophosphatase PpaX [Paenibacillus alginolyticus]MCY9665779.1 pyrophosphatase PpaX [Paenibacillus alginolyticus]
MYTTILFDLDGTIVDTNELIISSFMHVLKDAPNSERYTKEFITKNMGLPLREQLEAYTESKDVDQYIKAYRQYNESNHEQLVKPFPFVKETLEKLQKSGIHLGVVTSKIKKTAVMGLTLTGLLPYMDILVTEDDVINGKPDPEPILRALKQLQVTPENTLMVGDSEYDILSAKGAGVACAAVAWSLKGEVFLKTFSPDFVIHDIRELENMVCRQS